jgi:hypothetical protein
MPPHHVAGPIVITDLILGVFSETVVGQAMVALMLT